MERKSRSKVEGDRAGFSGPARSTGKKDWGDDWVHELIAMTRPGVEIEFPSRAIGKDAAS